MPQAELIPHLFRTEYRKIISVLCKYLGIEHIQEAEDIAGDTFLQAAETWGLKGLPENPAAWLYTVSKNKANDYIKRHKIFISKVVPNIKNEITISEHEIDLSSKNIADSQLQMMFAICHPGIPAEAQIGLSLRILCGFGITEIAEAFLTNKETINKRLARAKERLRTENIKIEFPSPAEINPRLNAVLTTLYLLFNEGYYSNGQNTTLRKDLCLEAMRLTYLLIDNQSTNKPQVNALLSLMCFHSSRFDARTTQNGEIILYEEQDETLWDKQLIAQGEIFLNAASTGSQLSKFHLEAAIAYWHTIKADSAEKWDNILQLYNRLLQLEYSPAAALNRTYALSKAKSKEEAIIQAEKLDITSGHLYHSLLANLYDGVDSEKSLAHLRKAMEFSKTEGDKRIIQKKINALQNKF